MKKKINININVLIFYFCYTLLLISVMFRQVCKIGDISSILAKVCMILLFLNIFLNIKYMNKKNILILYFTILLSFITKFITGNNTILLLCLLVFAAYNINLKKIIKYDICLKLFFLVIVACLYFNGFTNVNLHYRDGLVRHSMGFSNPNTFSAFVFSIVVEYLYLRKGSIKLKDSIITLFSIFIIDYFADSRTQIICLILLFIMLFINNKVNNKVKNNKFVKFLCNNIFLILTIISLLLVYLYNNGNEFAYMLDDNVSGRIRTSSAVYNMYDINLFGNKLNLVTSMQSKLTGEAHVPLDNAYIYILLSYGIITYIYIYFFIRKYMKKTFEENESTMRIIFIIFLISGLMERGFIEVEYNIFLIYFSHLFYRNKSLDLGDKNE